MLPWLSLGHCCSVVADEIAGLHFAQLAQQSAEAPGFVAASLLDDSVVALPRTVPAPAPPAAAGAGAAGSAASAVAETLPAKGPARRSWPLRLQVRRHKLGLLQLCLLCGVPGGVWDRLIICVATLLPVGDSGPSHSAWGCDTCEICEAALLQRAQC